MLELNTPLSAFLINFLKIAKLFNKLSISNQEVYS